MVVPIDMNSECTTHSASRKLWAWLCEQELQPWRIWCWWFFVTFHSINFIHQWMLIGDMFPAVRISYHCMLFHLHWILALCSMFMSTVQNPVAAEVNILQHGVGTSNELNTFQFVLQCVVFLSKEIRIKCCDLHSQMHVIDSKKYPLLSVYCWRPLKCLLGYMRLFQQMNYF